MRQSQLFTKTRKDAPSDETSRNAQLLIRAGYIHKNMAGVYEFLPLGLRVMNKIAQIVREEMNAIGGQEVKMTVLQSPDSWQKSGRWNDEIVDNWFKTKIKSGGDAGLGLTHEEPLADIVRHYVSSYRDLPVYPYQIQVKFRNELRAKAGIMRGREFLMKDLYSFSRTEEDRAQFYERVKKAYVKIFKRLGIDGITYLTKASGGIFSKYSDEFQMVTDMGEDTIYVDEKKKLAVNKELIDDVSVFQENELVKEKLVEKKAIEVGNIFPLGTRYAEAVGLSYADEKGENKFPIMGSYGIGISRLMGAIVEAFADEKGIVWPESVAPFRVHLMSLSGGEKKAEALYKELQKKNIEVLFDDREASAGEKFADADLLGIPYRVVVSARSLKEGGAELKKRSHKSGAVVSFKKLMQLLAA